MSRALSRAPIAAAAACAAGFGAVMFLVYGTFRAADLDARLFESLGRLATPARTPILDSIAHSADLAPLLAFLAVLAVLALRWGRRAHLIAALAAVAGAAITTQLLKIVLAHPRVQPALGHGIGPVSFPSGHATAAMSMAVALVLVAPRGHRWAAVILGAAYALAVSVTVIVLGWHYPSDVLAGTLVATGFGFLAIAGLRAAGQPAVEREAQARPRELSPGLEIGVALAGGAVAVAAISRADALIDYATFHTGPTFVAFGLAGVCAALLTALSAAAEE
jgi:membrane-associated phospholipid phosphatase